MATTTTKKKPLDKTVLTAEEAAEYLNTTVRMTRRLRYSGALPYIVMGDRVIRFLKSDLDDYLKQCRVGA